MVQQFHRMGDDTNVQGYADSDSRQHKQRHLKLFELWRKLDGVLRQVPNRCWVILSMDATGEVDTTLLLIGNSGSRIRDRRKNGPKMGHELSEISRSNQTCGSLDAWRRQSSVLDLAFAVQDQTPLGQHVYTPN